MSFLSSSSHPIVQGSSLTSHNSTTIFQGNIFGSFPPGTQILPGPHSPLPEPIQRRGGERSAFDPQTSNEIYSRLLMVQKRGIPLWIPEPNELLPISYRREGFSIGDVGFLTDFGGFSFLFNIYRPRDDPINPPVMPENFVPLPPLSPRMDLSQNHDLKPNTCIASSSVMKLQNDTPGALSFRTSSLDSAILVIPDGAISQDLLKAGNLDKYIGANLESWYRYAIGDLGRKIENGDIRVVTGWDKTESWGMATTQQQVSELTFAKAVVSPEYSSANSVSLHYSDAYTWDYSGMATVKTGPDQRETEALEADDRPNERYKNQCVFVRVKSAKLRDENWATLKRELGLVQVDSNPISGQHPGPGKGSSRNFRSVVRNVFHPTSKAQFQEDSEMTVLEEEETPTDFPTRLFDNCPIPVSPAAITYHPSDAINSTLLELFPAANVAITSDQDWCSVLTEDDQTLPDPIELWRRIEGCRSTVQENGLVSLKPGPLSSHLELGFDGRALPPPIGSDNAGATIRLPTYGRPVSSGTHGIGLTFAPFSLFNETAEVTADAFSSEGEVPSPVLSSYHGHEVPLLTRHNSDSSTSNSHAQNLSRWSNSDLALMYAQGPQIAAEIEQRLRYLQLELVQPQDEQESLIRGERGWSEETEKTDMTQNAATAIFRRRSSQRRYSAHSRGTSLGMRASWSPLVTRSPEMGELEDSRVSEPTPTPSRHLMAKDPKATQLDDVKEGALLFGNLDLGQEESAQFD